MSNTFRLHKFWHQYYQYHYSSHGNAQTPVIQEMTQQYLVRFDFDKLVFKRCVIVINLCLTENNWNQFVLHVGLHWKIMYIYVYSIYLCTLTDIYSIFSLQNVWDLQPDDRSARCDGSSPKNKREKQLHVSLRSKLTVKK